MRTLRGGESFVCCYFAAHNNALVSSRRRRSRRAFDDMESDRRAAAPKKHWCYYLASGGGAFRLHVRRQLARSIGDCSIAARTLEGKSSHGVGIRCYSGRGICKRNASVLQPILQKCASLIARISTTDSLPALAQRNSWACHCTVLGGFSSTTV